MGGGVRGLVESGFSPLTQNDEATLFSPIVSMGGHFGSRNEAHLCFPGRVVSVGALVWNQVFYPCPAVMNSSHPACKQSPNWKPGLVP